MNNEAVFFERKREYVEEWEERFLAPYACKSRHWHKTRLNEELEDPHRTAFQRDRDRIIYSNAFRNLSDRRQILVERDSEHNRSRLTHTVEVVQVSRTISTAMGLNNDLTEAISLGHDLGQPPFADVGESTLNAFLSGADNAEGVLPGEDWGGFKHNFQSLRVVDKLEKKYNYDGLNMTSAVREGILKHTSTRTEKYCYPDLYVENLNYDSLMCLTLEGQVAAIADKIAQRTFDLEDALRANYISLRDIRQLKIIQDVERQCNIESLVFTNPEQYGHILISGLVRLLVGDVVQNTLKRIEEFCERKQRQDHFDEWLVIFSLDVNRKQNELDTFMQRELSNNFEINRVNKKCEKVLRKLFKAYYSNPLQMTDRFLERYTVKKLGADYQLRKWPHKTVQEKIREFQKDPLFARHVVDYIASMSDSFAVEEYKAIYIPETTRL